jgi:hypothetical protein
MAVVNYFAGLARGSGSNPEVVVSGTATAGSAVDVELRMQIDPGTGATGLTRKDVVELTTVLLAFVNGGGQAGGGANLPGL